MSAVCPPVGVLHQERDQPAEAAHLLPRQLVLRVRLEAGIVHLFDPRMGFEKLGHALAVLVVPLHPQFERLQAAQQQVAILRAVDRAHDAAEIADRFELLLRTDHDAGQQIVVPGQVLRHRVEHVVDARRDRPQVVRRGQRGVDQRFDAVLAADFGEAVEVDDAQVRIGGRFADQQPRAAA